MIRAGTYPLTRFSAPCIAKPLFVSFRRYAVYPSERIASINVSSDWMPITIIT
jgi:hypothetical protein